jgi:PKD repeat protein
MLINRKSIALFLALLFVAVGGLHSQQIVGMEYFIDNDPGFGNGNPISTGSPSNTVSFNTAITLPGGLEDGFHSLGIRAISDSGAWSITESRSFVTHSLTVDNPVTALEYFYDDDPGAGNGIPITTGGASDTIRLALDIPLSGLEAGFHRLYIRALNEDGVWGIRDSRAFYIVNLQDSDIDGYEYSWDSLLDVGQGTFVDVDPPVDTFRSQEIIPIAEEMTLGTHDLYLRTRSTDGIWSIHEVRDVEVCTEYGAIAGFEIFIDDHVVYFSDSTQYVQSINWDFGNGGSADAVFNPVRYYEAGHYEVCQTVSNPCAVDTFCRRFSINGLNRIAPAYSANNGFVSIIFHGVGFTPATNLWLESASGGQVDMDTIIYIDSATMKANVLFEDDPVGFYHVIAEVPGIFIDTIYNGFELQAPIPFLGEVSIIPRGAVLRGAPHDFNVRVTNRGNQAGIAIPLVVAFDASLEILDIDYDAMYADSIPQNVLDSVPKFIKYVDSLALDSAYHAMVLIPYIGPGESRIWSFSVITGELGRYRYEAYLEAPWYTYEQLAEAGLQFRGSCNFLPPCLECAIDLAAVIPLPLIGCGSGLINTLCSVINLIADGTEEAVANVIDIYFNIAGTLASCADGAGLLKILALLLDFTATLESIVQGDCNACYHAPGPGELDSDEFQSVNSRDPNVKYGPAGATSTHYINGLRKMNYLITFENADTATAPAREVRITDVLDTNKLDINTLELLSYGYDDESFFLSENTGAFIRHHTLHPGISVLRVKGETNGNALEWTFSTYDADSFRLIDDISEGFLPPNINSPEGEGFIAFSIGLKPGYSHLDVIENEASIYFDANEAIVTPLWSNTIDLEKPSSAVNDLPAILNDTIIQLHLSGDDAHAGILDYSVYVSKDGGEFTPYVRTKQQSVLYHGSFGSRYKFYSIARDMVYNMEEAPADPQNDPDAETSLEESTTPVIGDELLGGLSIRPNPANDQSNISFNLKESSDVVIHSYNGNGTYRTQLLDELLGSGHYSFEVNTDNWGNGMYYLVIEVNGKKFARKLMVVND